jgi:hypothetical protein
MNFGEFTFHVLRCIRYYKGPELRNPPPFVVPYSVLLNPILPTIPVLLLLR